MSVLTLRSADDSITCGGRFKYIASEIPMNYNSLVNAVSEAIDKEAREHDNQFVTEERLNTEIKTMKYDFDALMEEFQNLVGDLMNKNPNKNAPLVTSIVEKYLGKGKKVSEALPDQAEFIYLINTEIKDELVK